MLCHRDTPDTGDPTVVLDGFRDPTGMTVTPDGRHAVVAAEYVGPDGLWLVDLADGDVSRIARGDFGSPSPSPDGTRVAVIRDQTDITILDMHRA